MLLNGQNKISAQSPMPVEDVSDSSKIISRSGITVPLYYYNAGVLTADAGQAAGVVVVATLPDRNIYDGIGAKIGSLNNKSLSFTCLALTREKEFDFRKFESHETTAGASLANIMTEGFANGDYCVDYKRGIIYAKKATTATSMTAVSYKTSSASSAIVDSSGNQVSSFGGASTVADYRSPADFTAAYTSASTITISGVTFTLTNAAQIVYIKVIKADNTSNIYLNGQAGYTFRIVTATGVITAYKDGAVVNIFGAATDVYEVGINDKTKSYEKTSDTTKITEAAPVYARETTKVAITVQTLTDAWVDFGAEIDMTGYNRLNLFTFLDVNSSENARVRALVKHTSAGTDEYSLPIKTAASPADGVVGTYYELTSDADQYLLLTFDVPNGCYVQLQIQAGTVGATAGTVLASYNKEWK